MEDPETEVFIERHGECFRHVLDCLRDGTSVLPITVNKQAVLADLAYFGVDNVN
jgi:hypothetical protein